MPLGGAASPLATPNRTGTHGRRGRVDQSGTTGIDDRSPIAIGNQIRSLRSPRSLLGFEGNSQKIAIAPDQSTTAHRAKIVERNAEFGRHDVQLVQSKAGAVVGDIAHKARVDDLLAGEVHGYVTIDRSAADGPALDVAPGLEYLLKSSACC